VYFWSGIHKVNAVFVHDTFPWMLEPFAGILPGAITRSLQAVAILRPIFEAAIGICLIPGVLRRGAVVAAVGMHAFILASIGPLGHNWDNVIWPWNIAMAWLVVLLFWPKESVTGRGLRVAKPAYLAAVVLLFGFAPALGLVGLLDGYLSFALYTGNRNDATIYMADAVADRLPEEVQEHIKVNDSKVDELDVFEWSFRELNVPPYGELRIYKKIGRQVCRAAGNPREMALIVQTKATWLRRKRQLAYDCESLSR
jgi:hypothetical protein